MYPMLRFLRVLRQARRRPRLAFDAEGEIELRCWPWDLDMFMELNNGRAMTLYDLGRFDLAARTGLAETLRAKNWGLAVAGGSIRFRRRVRGFDRIVMRSRTVARDERWFYIAQSMWVRGEAVSAVMLRTCVTAGGRIASTDMVSEAMGAGDWRPEPPRWVTDWIAADEGRPWPPEP